MRAVQITRFGGPEVLDDVGLLAARAHPEDRPRPPGAGPSVEPADLRVADRRLPGSRWGISPGSRC